VEMTCFCMHQHMMMSKRFLICQVGESWHQRKIRRGVYKILRRMGLLMWRTPKVLISLVVNFTSDHEVFESYILNNRFWPRRCEILFMRTFAIPVPALSMNPCSIFIRSFLIIFFHMMNETYHADPKVHILLFKCYIFFFLLIFP
jgi:hypothetical protein